MAPTAVTSLYQGRSQVRRPHWNQAVGGDRSIWNNCKLNYGTIVPEWYAGDMARHKGFDEDNVIERSLENCRRQGYEAYSIRDLVARLGVGSSSLYSTFGDKETLFMRALERHSHQERAMIRQRLAHPDHPQATIEH